MKSPKLTFSDLIYKKFILQIVRMFATLTGLWYPKEKCKQFVSTIWLLLKKGKYFQDGIAWKKEKKREGGGGEKRKCSNILHAFL